MGWTLEKARHTGCASLIAKGELLAAARRRNPDYAAAAVAALMIDGIVQRCDDPRDNRIVCKRAECPVDIMTSSRPGPIKGITQAVEGIAVEVPANCAFKYQQL